MWLLLVHKPWMWMMFSLSFPNLPVYWVLNRILMPSLCFSCLSSTLSKCGHAAVATLYPFTWQHTYVPVLPASMIDIVCSPTPFLIGILSCSLPQLRDLPIEEVRIEWSTVEGQCQWHEADLSQTLWILSSYRPINYFWSSWWTSWVRARVFHCYQR